MSFLCSYKQWRGTIFLTYICRSLLLYTEVAILLCLYVHLVQLQTVERNHLCDVNRQKLYSEEAILLCLYVNFVQLQTVERHHLSDIYLLKPYTEIAILLFLMSTLCSYKNSGEEPSSSHKSTEALY